jgi:SCF-associated factor 1
MTRSGSIPIPARLHIKVPVVDLVAGGWSFHVLSVHGKVYHWGQLDGGSFAPYRPASTSSIPLVAYPGAMVPSVTELEAQIPSITRMLSGRLHVLAMDDNGRLWTWAQWAEAGLISSSWLDYSKFRIADFAAGWTFSATLLENRQTKRRSAHVWWQRFLSPTLQRSTRPPTEQARFNMPESVESRHGCFHFDPQQALKLPDLGTADSEEHIEKLAAGEGYIIALSNTGKVFKLDLGQPILPLYGGMAVQPHLQGLVPQQQLDEDDDDDSEDGRMPRRSFAELERQLATGQRRWEYLEKFSESRYWQAEGDAVAASPGEITSSNPIPDQVADKTESKSRKIRFISANFRTFFCIGDGAVLQGSSEAHEDTAPIMKQELQNRGVIRWELFHPQ